MKKGFTLIELLAVIVILAIILAIAAPRVLGIVDSSYDNIYDINEDMLKRAVVIGVSSGVLTVATDGSTTVISLQDLIDAKLIDPLYDPKDKNNQCDGYVLVRMIDGTLQYKPYLQCGSNYETPKYGYQILDIKAPVITMLGNSPVITYLGDAYTDAGATANDDTEGDITAKIVTTNSVNINQVGTYDVTYNVEDLAGNKATTVVRKVRVTRPSLASIIAPSLTSVNNSNYYVGGTPNNWIQFGQVSSGDTTPVMWRIIKSDSEGIKIIYEGSKNGTSAPTADGNMGYVQWDTSESNQWERPAAIRTNINTWYNNFYIDSKTSYVQPMNWCVGGLPDTTNTYSSYPDSAYRLMECNTKTIIASPISLINVNDYMSVATAGGNFLNKSGYTYWTITREMGNVGYVRTIRDGASYRALVNLTNVSMRIVLNLRSNVLYLSGSGTLASPYQIAADPSPILALNGNSTVTIGVGDTYSDAGVIVSDDEDNLSGSVVIQSNVNPNTIGNYTVTYSVTDTDGNVALPISRTVRVIAPMLATKIAPSLVSKSDSNYFVGANPNNWIEFGQVSSSDTTPIMWRITKSNSEGIQLIYEGVKNGTNNPTDNGQIGVIKWDDYGANGINRWERPVTLKAVLNTWYNNLYVANKSNFVQPMNWCIAGPEGSITSVELPKPYFEALDCAERTGPSGYYYYGKTIDATPIGQIQALDYFNASGDSTCTASFQTQCKNLNYLYKGYYFWTFNVDIDQSYYVWTVSLNGDLGHQLATYSISYVRPVINLKADIPYISGSGTLASPYKVQ